MRSMTRAAFLTAVAGLAISASAQTTYPEGPEPNDTKAQATVVAGLLAGDRLTGATKGATVGGGLNSPDYFLVSPAALPPGIYRHQLNVISTPINGLFTSLRGLDQNAAGMIVAGGDVLIQSGLSGTVMSNVWYGFGRAEPLFLRVQGTSSSVPYLIAFSTAPVSLTQISPSLSSGDITILVEGTVGNPDAEIWVYDSGLNPIPGYNNDDPVFPMSPTDAASLTRAYGAGTYYMMIGLANIANHMNSPADEATPADDDVLDFAGALTPLGGVNGAKFANISIMDAQGVITLQQVPIQNIGRWFRFDVASACTPVAIVQAPASVTAAVSQQVTFEVYATGSDPIAYQWRFNGSDIAGATASAYMIPSISLPDAGSYTVRVSNPCGQAESSAAVLSVVPFDPQITAQPQPQTLCIGETATFSVSATPNLGGALAYQWRKDGMPLPLGQASVLQFQVVSLGDGGLYDCVVTESGLGSSTSDAALLTVKNAPPMIALAGSETMQIEAGVQVYQEPGATATDDCDPVVEVRIGGAVNSSVPAQYTLTYDATDSQGNAAATLNRYVNVVDTIRPAVDLSIVSSLMWPPNHMLRNVGLRVSAQDAGDPVGAAESIRVRVFCDEPEMPGDDFTGFFSPDAKDIAPNTLRLRAERMSQRDGRVYLVMATSKDSSGNIGFAFGTVGVPRERTLDSIQDVNAQAASMEAQAAGLAVDAASEEVVAEGLAKLGFVEHGKAPPRGPFQ